MHGSFTQYCLNVGQRLRRWPSIETESGECPVFAFVLFYRNIDSLYMYPPRLLPRQICPSPYVINVFHRLFSPGYERVYLPLCKVADTPFISKGMVMFKKIRDIDPVSD